MVFAVSVDNRTTICGLITSKPTNLSAAMHNAGYAHLGLNFAYIPFAVNDCGRAIAGMRALNIRGLSVSIPHKQEVMAHLDSIDPVAVKIGAVNTVVNDNGFLKGYNSDWLGATEALKEVCTLNNKKVVVFGAGGAARAIVYGLKQYDCAVTILNRTVEKARLLADEFGMAYGDSMAAVRDDYDIFINATSVGSADECPIDPEALRTGKIVMDIVTVPMETALLRCAKAKGCTAVPGWRMLLHQALPQFELFTGQKAPLKVMDEALLAAIRESE